MAENSVTTTFFASEKDAQAAIVRLEKKYGDLENKIKQVSRSSRKASQDSLSDFATIGGKFAGLLAGYLSIEGAVSKILQISREWRRESEQAARNQETATKNFKIQSGMFGLQGDAAQRKIDLAGLAAGVDYEREGNLPGALAGSLVEKGGFTGEQAADAIKQILPAFLANRAAKGGNLDPATYADALGDLIDKSMGGDRSAEGIAKATRDLFSFTRGAEVDVGELDPMMTKLKTMPAGKGGERHRKALAKLGLKFSDVDLVGEDAPTAFQAVASKVEGLAPEKQFPTLKELFEDADMANNFLAAAKGMKGNAALFDPSVTEITSGGVAGLNREKRLRQLRQIAGNPDFDRRALGMENLLGESGQNPVLANIGGSIASSAADAGVPNGLALSAGAGFAGVIEGLGGLPSGTLGSNPETAAAAEKRADALAKSAEETVDRLDRILAALERPRANPVRVPAGKP